jgi:peptidoglycan/xylan/chitin deacetylase (PgdA/CDA1 family)
MATDTPTKPLRAPADAASARAAIHEPARRWRPAPALQVTAALHVGGALALAWRPEQWPWIAATLFANHAVLFAASFAPRSQLLGPVMVRLPEAAARRGEVAITFDDGPDPEVTPRVLDRLDARGATASFFCVGERAAAEPALVREIVRRGHSVENHSERHSMSFGWYGPWRLRREIESAQRSLAAAAGVAPRFFRAPFGTRNPLLDPVLARLGLGCVAWTRRGYDTVDADATRVLGRLANGLAAGDVLLLHDGVTVRKRRGEPTVLAVLPRLLDLLAERGLKSVSLRSAYADGSDG